MKTAKDSPIVETPRPLGPRVRGLRQARGLTLEALAGATGISRAMLSKVERGERNPTLGVAARIASGLGVGLSDLLSGPARRRAVHVIRRRARAVFIDPESGFERHLLSPAFARRTVEFVMHRLPRGATSGILPAYAPGVTKMIVVEDGILSVQIGRARHRLQRDDAFFFEADVPHAFVNAGQGVCRYYMVVNSSRT